MAVHADSFARLVAQTSRLAGVPQLRHVFVPAPVPGRTPAELRAYVAGENPLSGRPFASDVVAGLTAPLSVEERNGRPFEHERSRCLAPAKEDGLQELFLRNGWVAANALTSARVWWGQDLQDLFFGGRARQGEEPWASYLKADPDELIPANVPEDIHVAVVGGRTAGSWIGVEGQPSGRTSNAQVVSMDRWR